MWVVGGRVQGLRLQDFGARGTSLAGLYNVRYVSIGAEINTRTILVCLVIVAVWFVPTKHIRTFLVFLIIVAELN